MATSVDAIVRDAAHLCALHEAMSAMRRNGGLRIADLSHRFVISLAKAREEPIFEQAPPTQFLGRGLTLLVRRHRGHHEACLTPNHYGQATLEAMLNHGDAGMFHRPEDWADTRYFDSFHSAFCAPSRWSRGLVPGAGIVAIAAQAAAGLVSEKALNDGLQALGIGTAGRDIAGRIRRKAAVVQIPEREPPLIPTRILRVASQAGLGYGECLAFWLYKDSWGPGLPSKQVAFLLGIDASAQVRTMALAASRKLPRTDTLMRLVPPWPAKDPDSSMEEAVRPNR